jgi:signal peptidase
MRPALEMGDLIVVQGITANQIKEQDIIVFDLIEDHETTLTVHRVIGIQTLPNGTRLFTTKGDNNTSPDSAPVGENQIHGRVIYRIPLIGYLTLDPMIPFSIVIIALIIILVWPERQRKKQHLHRPLFRYKHTCDRTEIDESLTQTPNTYYQKPKNTH